MRERKVLLLFVAGLAAAVAPFMQRSDGRGNHWPDVSAWYWSALTSASAAPWWSHVVAEAE